MPSLPVVRCGQSCIRKQLLLQVATGQHSKPQYQTPAQSLAVTHELYKRVQVTAGTGDTQPKLTAPPDPTCQLVALHMLPVFLCEITCYIVRMRGDINYLICPSDVSQPRNTYGAPHRRLTLETMLTGKHRSTECLLRCVLGGRKHHAFCMCLAVLALK